MKRLNEWILDLIPPYAFATEEKLRVHKLFIFSCFITSLFALAYCLMSMYIRGYNFVVAMVFSLIIFAALPFMLKRSIKLAVLANIYIGTIAVVYCFLMYWDGGIRTANVAPWIIMLPAMALLLQGQRTALCWLLIALVIIGAYTSFYFKGIKFEVLFDADKDPLFVLLSYSGVSVMVYAVISVFEKGKTDALNKLEAQKEALERLNREKSDFLSIVSHDLKNPLAMVRSFAEISALPDTTAEKRAYYLQNIAHASDRMFELIKNLLDVNLIESGKIVLYKEQILVNDWINEYVVRVSPLALVKQIQLLADLPAYPVILFTDKARLEQVIENYVSNALKYNSPQAIVIIRLTDNECCTEIAVTDNGPGISVSDQALLFKPYGVTSARPSPGEEKNGLGLAIVKKISEVLQSEAGCRSAVGEGSTFYIRFNKENTTGCN